MYTESNCEKSFTCLRLLAAQGDVPPSFPSLIFLQENLSLMIDTCYCWYYCCCSAKLCVMITLTVMVDVLDVNPPASGREWNMERCLTGLSPPNMPPPPRPNMPPGGGGCLHYAEYTLPLRNLMRWYAVLEICNGRDQLISWQSHFYAKPFQFHPPTVPIPSIWNILAYST